MYYGREGNHRHGVALEHASQSQSKEDKQLISTAHGVCYCLSLPYSSAAAGINGIAACKRIEIASLRSATAAVSGTTCLSRRNEYT